MFGLGGIFVEVLKDVVFRIVPLDENDASGMINEIKGKKYWKDAISIFYPLGYQPGGIRKWKTWLIR